MTRLLRWPRAALRLLGRDRTTVIRNAVYDAAGVWTSGLLTTVAPTSADEVPLTFLVPTKDRHIGRESFAAGAYEADVMQHALALLDRFHAAGGLRGKTFVDVGANVGTSTVLAVRRHGAAAAVAFEPEPRNFDFLRANVALNRIDDRTDCRQLAISTAAGVRELELSAVNVGDHRIRARTTAGATTPAPLAPPGTMSEEQRSTISVATVSLDDAVAASTSPQDIGLVWVDTQGHEGQVLASAPGLLSSGVPFIIEYWPYGLHRSDGLELLERLVGAHFRWFVDVRSALPEPEPADTLRLLRDRYRGESYTDLLLLP